MITKLAEQVSPDSQLTKRDLLIIQLLQDSIVNSPIKKDFICLQECSEEFILEMEKKLPENYCIITSETPLSIDQNAIIYNAEKFSINRALPNPSKSIFPKFPKRVIMDMVFENETTTIRLINVHLPCDREKNKIATTDICNYLHNTKENAYATILAGDMNNTEIDMKKELKKSFSSCNHGFNYIAPYPAVLFTLPNNNDIRSISIDHFAILTKNKNTNIELIPIENLIKDAKETLDILQ